MTVQESLGGPTSDRVFDIDFENFVKIMATIWPFHSVRDYFRPHHFSKSDAPSAKYFFLDWESMASPFFDKISVKASTPVSATGATSFSFGDTLAPINWTAIVRLTPSVEHRSQ